MESKLKYLEFIQAAINRMANNSFLLKGWSVTVVGALLAFGIKEMNCFYLLISLAVLFFFWLLDSYYLSRERLFIKLYNDARMKKENELDFSMDIDSFEGKTDWFKASLSRTMRVFYGGLLIIHLLILIF